MKSRIGLSAVLVLFCVVVVSLLLNRQREQPAKVAMAAAQSAAANAAAPNPPAPPTKASPEPTANSTPAAPATTAATTANPAVPAPPTAPSFAGPVPATVDNTPVTFAEAFPDNLDIDISTEENRAQSVARIKAAEDANLRLAMQTAKEKNWPLYMDLESGRASLTGINRDGSPVYSGGFNIMAAISANVYPLRTSTYAPDGLQGEGWTVGVWEPGRSINHPEFTERRTEGETITAEISDHATHVIGTIISDGHLKPNSKGMAPKAKVKAYTAGNDVSEMTSAAANNGTLGDKIFISNHSYGQYIGWDYGKYYKGDNTNGEPVWLGDPAVDASRDNAAGLYDSEARSWDALVYSAGYYLPFRAAGNDRGGKLKSGATFYWRQKAGGGWEQITDLANAPGEDGGRPGGYETTASAANAKNAMIIGNSQDAVKADWTSSAAGFFTSLGRPIVDFIDDLGGTSGHNDDEIDYFSGALVRDVALATPNPSSCWGPTDDGRIKPDLMANGTTLYSTSSKTNGGQVYSTYDVKTGTSMASPSAAGAAVLLQEYHHKLFGKAMRSSMLKALMIHTADDLESFGPDYRTGWGLLNAERAAEQLKAASSNPDRKQLYDSFLADADPANPSLAPQRDSETIFFQWDGVSPLMKATLVWNDPPGEATTREDRSSRLRNDLDLRIVTPSGHVTYPFVLDPENPSAPARLGDNVRDNVEQVYVLPEIGRYALVVSRKGQLSRYASGSVQLYGKQPFSLVLSGNSAVTQFQEGLDQVSIDWNIGGNAPWAFATGGSPDGVDFAQSKLTSSLQSSFVETVVEGGQRVSWWWTLDGPNTTAPILYLTANGREMARIDKATPWTPAFVDLPPGRYTMRWSYAAGAGVDAAQFSAGLDMVKIAAPATRGPFLTTRSKIPGKFQAEDFDLGAPGDAYNDSDWVNDGRAYRVNDGVDIQPTADGGAGYALFNTQDGEWTEYSVDVERSGYYTLEVRYAAAQAGSILRLAGRDVELPSTGGSDNWQTLSVNGFQLVNGSARMRLEWVRGGARLNWLNWINKPYPTRRAFASPTNPGAQPINVSSVRIQVEDFDTGGEGIAYHDTDVANTGGQYRVDESVDIKASNDPLDPTGFQVTQFRNGENLRFTTLAPAFDNYEVRLRLKPASPNGFTFDHGRFEISLNGVTAIITYNASVNEWITLTGRLPSTPFGLGGLTIACTDGMADVNWIEVSREPAKGLSKILYLNRTGLALDDFYPQPRGKGLYPRGFATFSSPLVENKDDSGRLNRAFEIPAEVADNYAVILAGYVVPAVTADYTFYIASDDQGELWLSTDESPVNSVLIASEPQWNASRAWTATDRRPVVNGRASNVSAPIHLVSGQRYYVESSMKEGTGGDHLAVAWWRPGLPAIADGADPIFAEFLRPLDQDPLYEPRSTWPAPAPITYGTPLGAEQLNMTLLEYQGAGVVTYDPPAGTVLPAGAQTLSAIFTPTVENSTQLQKTTNTIMLVVNPAPLTIRASDAQREAGLPNPEFTSTITGFKNGDGPGHLQPGVQYQTAATPSTPVGTYPITPFGAANPNYTITFQLGTLTITQPAKRSYLNIAQGAPLPGRIEAENYDFGGPGLGFADADEGNNGGQYRPSEGVDIEATTDTGGGFDIAWTAPGEWQEYSVNVAASGLYNLTLRAAQVGAASTVRIWMAGQPVTGQVILPDTGGYQNWVNITKWSIPLSAGQQVMRIEWLDGGANLNWIEWQPIAANDAPKNIVWWKFDDGFVDSVSQRDLLAAGFFGSTALPEVRPDSPTGLSEDRSIQFDGLAFLNMPEVDEAAPVNFEGRNYTVEAWVKFTRPADGKSILATWGHPGAGGWSVWIDANGNLGATSYGIVDLFTSATLADDGQWHHVAFIHQLGARMLFFIDGQLKETLPMDAGVAPTPDHTLHVGYELVDGNPINPFIGKMDRLRVTDYALQATQLDYPALPSDQNTRGLNRLVYRYIPGVLLNDLYPLPRGQSHFPNGPEPAGPGPLDSGIVENFEAPSEIGDNYAQILFGYLVPKVTGDYTFYIAADNESELWLSTNEEPANSVLLATEPIANPVRQWDSTYQRPIVNDRPVNVSAPVHLEAGKYYYVEAPMKEGTFDDHLGVTWQLSGQPTPENGSPAITSEFLRTTFIIAQAAPVVPPTIALTRSARTVTLSWTDTIGFVLERSDRLPATTWSNVPFIVEEGRASVTVNASGATGFFRLRKN